MLRPWWWTHFVIYAVIIRSSEHLCHGARAPSAIRLPVRSPAPAVAPFSSHGCGKRGQRCLSAVAFRLSLVPLLLPSLAADNRNPTSTMRAVEESVLRYSWTHLALSGNPDVDFAVKRVL